MRVTERSIFDNANRMTAAAREREAIATEKAGTGVAVRKPWDSPDTGRVAREKIAEAQASAIAASANRSLDELVAVDGALGRVSEILGDSAALAVQMANATFSAEDRQRAAGQVREQAQAIIGALNVDIGGRFLLGGTADGRAPFTSTGAYVGDSGVRRIEIAPGGVLQDVSVRADVAIAGAPVSAGGAPGVDVLAALEGLAVALEANDIPAVRARLDEVNAGIGQVSTARSSVGSMQLAAEAASITATALADGAAQRKAAITDADFIEAATELALAERSLEAGIAASAKSFQLSLLDRL